MFYIKYFRAKKALKLKPVDKETAKLIKDLIRNYFSDLEKPTNIVAMEVTKIEILENSDKFEINMELVRPGLMIGKGGKTIGSLVRHLSTVLEKEVKINLKDSDLWN